MHYGRKNERSRGCGGNMRFVSTSSKKKGFAEGLGDMKVVMRSDP